MRQEREARRHILPKVMIRVIAVLSTTHHVGFPSPIWPQEPPTLEKTTKKPEKPK